MPLRRCPSGLRAGACIVLLLFDAASWRRCREQQEEPPHRCSRYVCRRVTSCCLLDSALSRCSWMRAMPETSPAWSAVPRWRTANTFKLLCVAARLLLSESNLCYQDKRSQNRHGTRDAIGRERVERNATRRCDARAPQRAASSAQSSGATSGVLSRRIAAALRHA